MTQPPQADIELLKTEQAKSRIPTADPGIFYCPEHPDDAALRAIAKARAQGREEALRAALKAVDSGREVYIRRYHNELIPDTLSSVNSLNRAIADTIEAILRALIEKDAIQ